MNSNKKITILELPEEIISIILRFTKNPIKYSIINKLFFRLAYSKEMLTSYFNRQSTQYKKLALKTPLLGNLLLSMPSLHAAFNLYDYLQVTEKYQRSAFKKIIRHENIIRALDTKDLVVLGKINTSMAEHFSNHYMYHFMINPLVNSTKGFEISHFLEASDFKDITLHFFEQPGYCETSLKHQLFKNNTLLWKILKPVDNKEDHELIFSNLRTLIKGKKSIKEVTHVWSIFLAIFLSPILFLQLKKNHKDFFKHFEPLYTVNTDYRPNYLGALYELKAIESKTTNRLFKPNEREKAILEITHIVSKQAQKRIAPLKPIKGAR